MRATKNVRTYLYTSIGANLVFILTVAWYIAGPFYLGPLLIGIVSGIVLLIQIVLLILCIRNIYLFGFLWKIGLTMCISGFSILETGFFCIVWFLFFIA